MPLKKAKKGKGKGKKDGKQESKRDKESDIEKAKANAALWEAKCDMTESSRVEYYDAARRLSEANRQLTDLQRGAEKSSIDIIAVLRDTDLQNEEKITSLEQQIQSEKRRAFQEKENMAAEYNMKIDELEEMFKKRSDEFNVIQGELKIINDFLMKKPQMEQELKNMKDAIDDADREHKNTLARLDQKFLNNKVHLESEAEEKIAVLAEGAHNEAVVQLDDASRSMFKENVRLHKALGYHIREVEDLRKRNVALAEENDILSLHKEMSQDMSNDTISKITAQRSTISELRVKVSTLEQTLVNMVQDFEEEKAEVKRRAVVRAQASSVEQDKLQKLLSLRDRELSRVKRIARSVVEQRSDMEILFHEALNQVKEEMLTHSNPKSSKLYISEMTWEQTEMVLRLLFAKMNALKFKKRVHAPALTDSEGSQSSSNTGNEEESHATFLTQALVSSLSSSDNSSALPDLY